MEAHQILMTKNPEERGKEAFLIIRALAGQNISEKGYFTICFPGGTGPVSLFKHCIQDQGKSIDWNSVYIFLNDDRCVPHDDHRSNVNLLNTQLVQPLGLTQNFYPTFKQTHSLESAAENYSKDITDFFADKKSEVSFDCMVLGMGADGHTASLFPDAPALEEQSKLVVPVELSPTEPRLPRLTMTLPLINQSRVVIFLTGGNNRRELFHKAAKKGYENKNFPASLVKAKDNLIWIFSEL